MGLVKSVEIRLLDSFKGGMAEFFTPQSSHQTMLVTVPGGARDDLYVHHFQTDQLLVVRGSMVLVVLQNRQYRYIPLHEDRRVVVQIPPGVPHSAINLSSEPCVMVNAVLRHGAACAKDYRPMRHPLPYDWQQVQRALTETQVA
jgi:uncharacterized RmlC-like cupin family protein